MNNCNFLQIISLFLYKNNSLHQTALGSIIVSMLIEWNIIYIISQIITIIFYGLFAWSYFLKTRKMIIIVGSLAVLFNAVAFILLGAWSGVAMCAIALARNLVCYWSEGNSHRLTRISDSKLFLIVVFITIFICSLFTYEGFLSLMSIFATSIYSYSVWQKRPNIYKWCGIPVGILWIVYNIFIMSIFGIILESCLLIFVVGGILKSRKADNPSKIP